MSCFILLYICYHFQNKNCKSAIIGGWISATLANDTKGYDKGNDSARYGFNPKYNHKRIASGMFGVIVKQKKDRLLVRSRP